MNRTLVSLVLVASLGLACGGTRKPNANVCDPNPCTQSQKNLCVVEDGNARCLCNAGFVQRPNGTCEEINANNCPEHPGDAEEPNDCQAKARELTANGTAKSSSISPAGDYDYFRFSANADTIYNVVVNTQSALYPRIDVFDQGGLHVGLSERLERAQFAFKAKATAPYFVRISHSPLDPSVATGDYAVTVNSAGSDDYGDTPNAATAIAPDVTGQQSPQIFNGKFEYAQDVDWFNFSGTINTLYTLAFDASREIPTVALYANANDETPQFVVTQPTIDFYVPQNGTAYLAMYPATSEAAYQFTFTRQQ